MSSSPNSLSSSDGPAGADALAPLADVRCGVDIVLGSASMSVRECLALQPQAIVRLGQSAGGDMEVRVNGVPVAAGEVVIVDDAIAIRVTEILPAPGTGVDE